MSGGTRFGQTMNLTCRDGCSPRHRLLFPQVPRPRRNLLIDLVRLLSLLRLEKGNRTPESDRLELHACVDLGVGGAEDSDLNRRGDDIAMSAHQ
jgi:hypothetical protein